MKLLFILFSACVLLCHGVLGVKEITVSVMKGDLVFLHSGVETNQRVRIRWYFNDIRLAQINGDVRKTCKNVHCDGKFRDRLELESKTGSLTITRIMTSDAGLYKLRVLDNPSNEKIFSVTVHDQKKAEPVKERESVTLYTGVVNPDALMTWYFNDSLIAEIHGHPNKTCTDVQCEDGDGRFRDRLKLDHQNGSLTITNTTTTDSGEYKLQINSSSSCIIRSFSVTVFDSRGLPPAKDLNLYYMKAVFVIAVLLVPLVVSAVCVICFFCRKHKLKKQRCSTANFVDSGETDTSLQ